MKNIIKAERAPAAIGPYSQAIDTNGILFVSGQIPLDPESGNIVEGGIREQTIQVIKNIDEIVKKAGYELTDIVKCTCFLRNLEDFQMMNEIYGAYFKANPPSRSTFEVSRLPKDVLVEIDAIAVR